MFSFQGDSVWEIWITQLYLMSFAISGFALFVRHFVVEQAMYITVRPVAAVAMAISVAGITGF